MKVCIVQPSYIPWKGYFHLIQKADVFVFLDTVQYDKRGWRNRNKIISARGPIWLTIPVSAKGTHDGLPITSVKISDPRWHKKHIQAIRLNYAKAPFFNSEFPWIEDLYQQIKEKEFISDITCHLSEQLSKGLGLANKRFHRSSELGIDNINPSQRLLDIAKHFGGDVYLTGPTAKQYLETYLFREENIGVEWMLYQYPSYEQFHSPFTHTVSIIDMIMMLGRQGSGEKIWGTSIKGDKDISYIQKVDTSGQAEFYGKDAQNST